MSIAMTTGHGFISSPTRFHRGDLVIEANQTFTIEDRSYNQDGDIIVKDNAPLLIENAELTIDQRDRIRRIVLEDSTHLVIKDAQLNVITHPRAPHHFRLSVILLQDNAELVINKSTLVSYNIIAYNSSQVTITRARARSTLRCHDATRCRPRSWIERPSDPHSQIVPTSKTKIEMGGNQARDVCQNANPKATKKIE